MKGITIACTSLLLLLFTSCDDRTPAEKAVANLKAEHMADSIVEASKAKVMKEIGESQTWEYTEDTDKMTSKVTTFAELKANSLLDLDFPYKDSQPYILLRSKRGSTDVMFGVSKGQLHHAYDDAATISVRFDSTKAENYYCDEPDDGSSNVYFIRAKSKFIRKLKNAKKVFIETEFYQNGLKVMEFNASGLKWEN